MKKYLVQIRVDGETSSRIMTERELADLWETEDLAGVGYDFTTYDIDIFGHVSEVDTWSVVKPVLENKRWMEQEYRDYCEAVNEYGYDFESMDC